MRRLLMFGLLTALLLAGCCNDPLTGCYTVGAVVLPTPPPDFGPPPDPVKAVELYYATFNDTTGGVPAGQRFAQMHSLLLPSDACNRQRFVAMQLAIRDQAGIYTTVAVQPTAQLSGDGQQATVVAVVSTVAKAGQQTFTLVDSGDGWLIATVADDANGSDYNWPPNPNAAWYKAVVCDGR